MKIILLQNFFVLFGYFLRSISFSLSYTYLQQLFIYNGWITSFIPQTEEQAYLQQHKSYHEFINTQYSKYSLFYKTCKLILQKIEFLLWGKETKFQTMKENINMSSKY